MILRKWDKLPDELRVPEVRPYYDVLSRRRGSIALKRVFDFLRYVIRFTAHFGSTSFFSRRKVFRSPLARVCTGC